MYLTVCFGFSVEKDPICVTCWRGKEQGEKGSLNLFVTKQELESVQLELRQMQVAAGLLSAEDMAVEGAAGGDDKVEEPPAKKQKA